jgi:hypothetical protein
MALASRIFSVSLNALAPVAFIALVAHVVLTAKRPATPTHPEHVCMMKNPEYCIYKHVP